MPVIHIDEDNTLDDKLSLAGDGLVVVAFSATWCTPCLMVAPAYEELSDRYGNSATFYKVDVTACPMTSKIHQVSSMPTFILYKNRQEITRTRGAQINVLEAEITKHITSKPAEICGHMDLNYLYVKSNCECKNESDDHSFLNFLESENAILESDCDEQLIINITFQKSVKLHSIAIKAPLDKGPKNMRIFINQPQTLDFDQVFSRDSVQDICFTKKDLENCTPVLLKYVRFQNVQNIILFIKDNQDETETTVLEKLKIIGSPISTTNMNDFKRITGKKDEKH